MGGIIWVFVTPLMLLAVYTFVFSVVFKTRWNVVMASSKTAFALIMLCGMMTYNVFSESISSAAGMIVGNPNYVKKVVFPLEILPVSAVLSALFFFCIWSVILLLGLVILMSTLCVTIIAAPLILLPLALASCGVAFVISSIGVYFRDVQHIIGICIQILFFMTPIFYPLEMVPEKYRWVLMLNPLTLVIGEMRKVFVFNQWPDPMIVGGLFLVSLVIFQIGYIWFMKTKRGFADVL